MASSFNQVEVEAKAVQHKPKRPAWPTLRRHPIMQLILALGLLLILSGLSLWSLRSGAVDVSNTTITEVLREDVANLLRLSYRSNLDYTDRIITRDATLIRTIRLPRIVLGALVGAGLGLAGAALQGVLRNRLADPGLIGIASGGAIGAVTAILLGVEIPLEAFPGLGDFQNGARLGQIIFAFGGALLVMAVVYRAAYRGGRSEASTLLLLGLAINAIGSSYVGLVTFIAGPSKAGDISFWMLGSAATAFWRDIHLLLPILIVGLIAFMIVSRGLNLMALGESEARHLGVEVERLRTLTLGLAALLVGGAVALVGMVGFVGLLAPHIMRGLFGPNHRVLLPMSALGGAILVMGADLFARSIVEPSEVPLGVVTTLIGGPFFLFLILNQGRGRRL